MRNTKKELLEMMTKMKKDIGLLIEENEELKYQVRDFKSWDYIGGVEKVEELEQELEKHKKENTELKHQNRELKEVNEELSDYIDEEVKANLVKKKIKEENLKIKLKDFENWANILSALV